MNDYLIKLNLPENYSPLKDEIITVKYEFKEVLIPTELIKNDFINLLDSFNLKICKKSSRAFYRTPNFLGSIHVDAYDNPATKLNFVYDSSDCNMIWYRMLPDKLPKDRKNTRNEIIRQYDRNDCEEAFTANADHHCLVNAMIPHSVKINHNNFKIRKCYSFCLLDKFSDKRVTWENAVLALNTMLVT